MNGLKDGLESLGGAKNMYWPCCDGCSDCNGPYYRPKHWIETFDIADPANPRSVGTNLGSFAGDESTLVVSESETLWVRRLQDSAWVEGVASACDGPVAVEGDRAAIACADGIRLYDLSDPTRPFEYFRHRSSAADVALLNGRIYASKDGIRIVEPNPRIEGVSASDATHAGLTVPPGYEPGLYDLVVRTTGQYGEYNHAYRACLRRTLEARLEPASDPETLLASLPTRWRLAARVGGVDADAAVRGAADVVRTDELGAGEDHVHRQEVPAALEFDLARHEAGEARLRVWRVYMAGSAHAFERGWLSLWQLLAGRPFDDGRLPHPLTRDYMYGSRVG